MQSGQRLMLGQGGRGEAGDGVAWGLGGEVVAAAAVAVVAVVVVVGSRVDPWSGVTDSPASW